MISIYLLLDYIKDKETGLKKSLLGRPHSIVLFAGYRELYIIY